MIFSIMIWINVSCDVPHWSAEPHHSLTGYLWGCAVLVLSVCTCSIYYCLDSVIFNHGGCDLYSDVYVHVNSSRPIHLGFAEISSFWFCNYLLPSLDIIFEYWIEYM